MSSAAEPRGSLERSLQWALALLVLLAVAALTGAAAWVGRQAAIDFIASRLAHDVEALIAGLDPQARTLGRGLPPVYDQPLSGHYFQVLFDDGGRLRSRSLWDSAWAPAPMPPGETAVALEQGPRGQHLLVWRAGYQKEGVAFTLVAAEDVEPLLASLRRFLVLGAGLALAAAAALLAVQRLLLRRGFRRLDAVRADIRRLTLGETGRLREDVPSEVRPLVAEVNQLIDAWRGHLQRSRNALGNLAHALKSPLSLIQQHAVERDDDGAVIEQARRMRQLVDRELHRARLAGSAAPARPFAPHEDVGDLVATIRALYADRGLEIETEVRAPPQLPQDQEDMLELIGNLLDNAAKWGHRRIALSLRADRRLRVSVEDDGPGASPETAGAMTARGGRLDEAVPGHGLGLAIVNDIVELYAGTLSVARSERLGGLAVSVELPLQPRGPAAATPAA